MNGGKAARAKDRQRMLEADNEIGKLLAGRYIRKGTTHSHTEGGCKTISGT